jgi:hypothetical protein
MIDLQQFCGDDETRPYLMKPFTRNGYTWATNGHILVRVAARADALPIEKDVNTEKVIEGIGNATFHRPSFQLPPAPTEAGVCPDCDGRGAAHDCPDCECTCQKCNGRGDLDVEKMTSTTIGPKFYNLHYVRMILSLPGIELSVVATKPKFAVMFFRFDEGVGCVMNRSDKLENHVEIETKGEAA